MAQEATPTPAAMVEEIPSVEATPVPTPPAVAETIRAAQVTPVSTPMAAAVYAAAAAAQPTPTPTPTAAPEATPTPGPISPPPSACATPVELMSSGEPTPSADGVCRVSAAVCSILGTDGDDVLTGSPFDDIICGLGGNDRLEGGDGDDVLFGGEGDDVLAGGAGDDCMVGGPGDDEAENAEEDAAPEVEHAADIEPGPSYSSISADGMTFDSAGRCTGATSYSITSGVITPAPRSGVMKVAPRAIAPTGAAPAAPAALAVASPGSGGVRLGLPDGRLAVRDDMVRVRVFCSAAVPAELVLLDYSQRIAHKRFTCTPPETTVRVRMNKAGRKLVARDDRVQTRLLVLAGGRTVSRQVLLVSPGG